MLVNCVILKPFSKKKGIVFVNCGWSSTSSFTEAVLVKSSPVVAVPYYTKKRRTFQGRIIGRKNQSQTQNCPSRKQKNSKIRVF